MVAHRDPNTDTEPVAVVGAGGFIGTALMETLTAAGVPAMPLTRSTPAVVDGRPAPGLRAARVIFYLASSINPALAELHPERVAADHAAFTALLAALRRAGSRPALVLASSAGAVYSPDRPPPYRETDPVGPTTAYGRAKVELERALFDARDAVRPVAVRIANAYGPRQRTGTMQGVIGHWLEAAAAGLPLRLYGRPQNRRDYVYVDDVAEALLLTRRFVLRAPETQAPEVFNIGSGVPVSLAALARMVSATVGRELPVERLPDRGFDRRDVWFDVRRADEVLGWRPRTSLRDGLRRTWQRLTTAAPTGPVR
ncbi:UDP-glucose 4-epimerase [Actinomadura rubrobrunea]|uniref:UDP-glucose 4-epimerase n=1 Tax=Actinomadura rubrobrunea TaxID=115335 RepID=A0A9W6PVW0_9ACTN|nr:NAD-dependent epimerase/dehydratase family protein [Actinomadura rubrobrunea]GLW63951.1 UDP-glucose 4-epimerase [Actinomadura rubrobrunea]